ncbi:hypothetical protein [Tuwongella immobilis]|uniref:Uncharacterized protein n=1 Tax=Tuwongella immobilis TaxID=692036 RepID=A0A6C2YK19_9BACT|nr:hypothetical protein [Tuwongella immobilis]VIP01641.1 unnamed protein product [Tuwongella immobilis]VTR99011.1 unnamed protein product [Tuwongella immobilis]
MILDAFLADCSNFFAGWADGLSFGITSKIRGVLNDDDVVDKSSSASGFGTRLGLAYSLILGFGPMLGMVKGTTGEHPFFEESLGWIETRSLPPGHQLRTLDDTSFAVESLAETGQWQPVTNLRGRGLAYRRSRRRQVGLGGLGAQQ